ncbi:hypothetical protein U1Q18_022249 [Sarracenia purpurea var. burkii]
MSQNFFVAKPKIEYHKKFTLYDLSQSRLGGEATTDPFIFLEGYGHYLLHEQMLNEPLEEIMGKLLEVNPSAATQLLESRGLAIMPMDLVDPLLHQAVLMFNMPINQTLGF